MFINDKAILAHARRSVMVHFTPLVFVAFECWTRTGIVTFFCALIASQIGGTVRVVRAGIPGGGRSGLHILTLGIWTTCSVRPARVAWWARASRPVQDRFANSVHSAGTSQRACINAPEVDARLLFGAF